MNNKILARLVATVMAIAMLGTVSFAASLTTANTEAGGATTLNVATDLEDAYAGYGANDVKTFIAYATNDVDAVPAADDIIAIAQVNDGTAISNAYTVDNAKLNKDYIVVRFGGKDTPVDNTIAFANDGSNLTVENNITVADKKYVDVAYIQKDLAIADGQAIKSYGFRVKNTAGATGAWNYFTGDTVLEAGEGGAYSFSILFTGISGTALETLVAESFSTVE